MAIMLTGRLGALEFIWSRISCGDLEPVKSEGLRTARELLKFVPSHDYLISNDRQTTT